MSDSNRFASDGRTKEQVRLFEGVRKFRRRPVGLAGLLINLMIVVVAAIGIWKTALDHNKPDNKSTFWGMGYVFLGVVGLGRTIKNMRDRANTTILEISPSEIVFRPHMNNDPERIPMAEVRKARWEADDRICLFGRSGGYSVLNLEDLEKSDLPMVREELSRFILIAC